jgi:hypothetical protein
MNKNWNESIVEMIGTLKTDENGAIVFKPNQFGKYTATLKVAANTPLNILARKSTFVFVDGLREIDVKAFEELANAGEINGTTRLVVTGHLVRTPGKPGMNDMFNLKTLGIRPAAQNESIAINLDEALTKDEWQVIRKEKFGGTMASAEAPTAPVAPSVPF